MVFSLNEKFNGGKLGGAHETFVSARRGAIRQHGRRVSCTDVMPPLNVAHPNSSNSATSRVVDRQANGANDLEFSRWRRHSNRMNKCVQVHWKFNSIRRWDFSSISNAGKAPIWTVFSSSTAGILATGMANAICRWHSNSTQNNIDRNW